METVPDIAQTLSPLEQRRAQWRDFSDRVAESIQKIPMPTTWLEGERAMRCIGTSDRVVTQIFNKAKAPTPKPVTSQIAAPTPVRELSYAPQPEVPVVPVFDDEDDDGDTETGKALDAMLDDMETILDDLDAGKKQAASRTHALKASASSDRFARHYDTTRFLFDGLEKFCAPVGASP